MARQPRFFVRGGGLHVIQRGNNREAIFATDEDFRFFVSALGEASERHGLAIHAYALMTNHLHLVVTPSAVESLPKTLQSVGRRYVQFFKCLYQRTGTLRKGRYRATLIDSDEYLLNCMRYVELNFVRAGMVDRPSAYEWSSHRANAYARHDPLVTFHSLYDDLARTSNARAIAYRALFETPLKDAQVDLIRQTTNKNWALGNDRFRQQVEALVGRRTAPARRGPPARSV